MYELIMTIGVWAHYAITAIGYIAVIGIVGIALLPLITGRGG